MLTSCISQVVDLSTVVPWYRDCGTQISVRNISQQRWHDGGSVISRPRIGLATNDLRIRALLLVARKLETAIVSSVRHASLASTSDICLLYMSTTTWSKCGRHGAVVALCTCTFNGQGYKGPSFKPGLRQFFLAVIFARPRSVPRANFCIDTAQPYRRRTDTSISQLGRCQTTTCHLALCRCDQLLAGSPRIQVSFPLRPSPVQLADV